MILCLHEEVAVSIAHGYAKVTGKAMAGFLQDDWRITSRLILNLGLRYEFTTPIKEANKQFANFTADKGLLQLGKNTDQMWNPDKNNFAPRIGFAYDLTGSGRTVIRGGANVIYVTPGWWIFLSQQNQNNPFCHNQCQSCHAQQFDSFAHGHPAFGPYPFGRPTRILFDHIKHVDAHFQDPIFTNHTPAYCTACHQTDPAGRTMLVSNFAATCAACHLRQIREEWRRFWFTGNIGSVCSKA